MNEILEIFVSKDESRLALTRPFSDEKFTYATDGKWLVRVPKTKHKLNKFPQPDISQFAFDHKTIKSWIEIPKFKFTPAPERIQKKDCVKCAGSGEMICPSCNGEEIELEHSFQDENGKWQYKDYTVECEYCNETGFVDCPDCESEIEVEMKPIYVQVGVAYIDGRKLQQLLKFKNVKIEDTDYHNKPVRFMIGEDVLGYIMPLRNPNE